MIKEMKSTEKIILLDILKNIEDLNKIVEEHKLNLDGDYYHNLYL